MSTSRSLTSVLRGYSYPKAKPIDVYSDLFRLGDGYIQKKNETHKDTGKHKSNPIILGEKDGKVTRSILFEDTFEETLEQYQQYDWAITNGVTYWGRSNKADTQGALYGLIFDLDGVTPDKLENFLSGALQGRAYPIPNYIVLSGHGIHLYYVLDKPLQLFPYTKIQVKTLKYALTNKIWNMNTSTLSNKQYQGINQGFRVIGGKTKLKSKKVQAYKISSNRVSIDYLNSFVPEEHRIDLSVIKQESKYTLEQAKKLFPDWYQRRVINHEPTGQWVVNENLYKWWLNQIWSGATYGHRYFCVMALAIFAAKCGIYDEERVRKDALNLVDKLSSLDKKHPFTTQDINSALECLDRRYVTFPRHDLEKLTGISMPANKRNGRKREQHLVILHATNAAKRQLGEQLGGKPCKRDEVRAYFEEHPRASVRIAAHDLGVSTSTIRRWHNSED